MAGFCCRQNNHRRLYIVQRRKEIKLTDILKTKGKQTYYLGTYRDNPGENPGVDYYHPCCSVYNFKCKIGGVSCL